MAIQDCIALIRAAADDAITDDQAMEIMDIVQQRATRRRASSNLASLEDDLLNAADEFTADAQAAAKIERRNRAINILRKRDLLRAAEETDQLVGDPSLGIEARLVGVNAPISEGRRSVDAIAQALSGEYLGGLVADLRRAAPNGRLLTLFNSGDLDLEVARALEKLSKPSARGSTNADAVKIAEIIRKYQSLALARENRAGAWIRPLDGYIVRQDHQAGKMERAGFGAWRDGILPRLDQEATFRDAVDTDAFLQNAYNGLVTGEHVRAGGASENDLKLAFKGPGNLARRVSAHRKLHFKSADDWFAYNREFGSRSLREAVVADLERAARNTGLMDRFGTNPRTLFDEALEVLRARYRDRGEPKKVRRLERVTLQWFMNEVDGTTRAAHNPTAARIGANIRAGQSMAKLGRAALSSIADWAFKAGELRFQGRSLPAAWGQSLGTFLDGAATSRADRIHISELIGVGLDGQIGDLVQRFSANDQLSGRMSRLMRGYFKLNLLTPWTNANRRGIAQLMARDLAIRKNTGFDALPDRTRHILRLYGIDAQRWDIARRAVRVEADGREYLMPDAIRDLPDSVVGAQGRAARQLRDEVSDGIRAYYHDRADFAIPTPGARERALLTAGTRPGDAAGEAARFISQFKAFPVTVTTKGFGRDLFGGGARSFSDALLKGQGDLLGIANTIVGSTVLGYLAMSAKDISSGRTPRTEPSAIIAAALQGGGLGIYGDFLFGEILTKNSYGNSPIITLLGPTVGLADDMITLISRTIGGDDTAATAVRLIIQNAPGGNLFYTKAALDYLILFQLQEAMNPGYLRRMERSIEREQGQRFLLPPSTAVPRGGGDRVLEGVR